MQIIPSGQTLGAGIEDIDLTKPLSDADFRTILRALGQHGVLRFSAQTLSAAEFAAFGRRFGELEINVANAFHEPGFPEVMILSNMTDETGEPIGLSDAGQGWHTDMSYARQIALANILHCQRAPRRYGKPLGETQFRNMHAAYEDLPASIKQTLEGRTATHEFAKFWDKMRARPGSQRPPLTEEQLRRRPPVSQPLVQASHHGAQSALRQPWLHDVDRRHGGARRRTAS
jgi:alpha-ketoglutarate-dependent taurine dioxygenase